MEKILEETERLATEYFKAFGFEPEQVKSLIEKGKEDLHNELIKLRQLLSSDSVAYTQIDHAAHTIKGILLQLGNENLANKLNELRDLTDETSKNQQMADLLQLDQ